MSKKGKEREERKGKGIKGKEKDLVDVVDNELVVEEGGVADTRGDSFTNRNLFKRNLGKE